VVLDTGREINRLGNDRESFDGSIEPIHRSQMLQGLPKRAKVPHSKLKYYNDRGNPDHYSVA